MRKAGKIKGIIFDALFICDIENDKIAPELHPELNNLVDRLVREYPPEKNKSISSAGKKISITRESLDTIHQNVMDAIIEGFKEAGMEEFEESETFKKLAETVRGIIQHEKNFRDEEKKFKL